MNRAEKGARGARERVKQSDDFRRLPMAEMEAIVARFEQRVMAAQETRSPNKDEAKKAVRRQAVLKCPVWLNELSYDVIVRYGDDLADLFCERPDDLIFVEPYDQAIGHQGQRSDSPLHQMDYPIKD